MFNLGSSYFHVPLTTVRHLLNVISQRRFPSNSAVCYLLTTQAALTESPNDCQVVKLMKQRIRQSLNYRLPITELHVVAAMLDPSQRNLNAVQCRSTCSSVE